MDGRQYFFSFEDVQTIFNYKNAYTFGLGEPKVKCLCDCPGVENHCSPSRLVRCNGHCDEVECCTKGPLTRDKIRTRLVE